MLRNIPLNISNTAKVLEIGPGANPHPRSDIYLELSYENKVDAFAQSGYKKPIRSNKTIFYNGNEFPFENNSFDYVICSHVLEHVENIEFFICELCRVATKGYLEYPTIYYDYLFNIPEHLNFLKRTNDNKSRITIKVLKKNATQLNDFLNIQKAFNYSLFQNYGDTIITLYKKLFIEGFEWSGIINIKKVESIEDVIFSDEEIQALLPINTKPHHIGIKNSIKILLNETKFFLKKQF